MAEAQKKQALPDAVFAVQVPNHELLKLAYDSYLAQARQASHGNKRALAEHALARPATQFGVAVVLYLARVVTKTTPKSYPRRASASLLSKH